MKSITKVAIRMMAIYYIVLGISNLPSILYYIGKTGDSKSFNTPIEYVSILLPIIIYILTGIILWIVTDKIAKSMLYEEEKMIEFPLPMLQIVQVAIIIIGVVLVVNSIPVIISNIYLYRKLEGFQTIYSIEGELIKQSIKTIIGILLVVFAPYITKNIFKVIQK